MEISKSIVNALNAYIFKFCVNLKETKGIPLKESLLEWLRIQEDDESLKVSDVENVFGQMIKLYEREKKMSKKDTLKSKEQNSVDAEIENEEIEINDEIQLDQLQINESSIHKCENPVVDDKLDDTINVCKYMYSRGPNKGKTCNNKTKDDIGLCTKHAKAKSK